MCDRKSIFDLRVKHVMKSDPNTGKIYSDYIGKWINVMEMMEMRFFLWNDVFFDSDEMPLGMILDKDVEEGTFTRDFAVT